MSAGTGTAPPVGTAPARHPVARGDVAALLLPERAPADGHLDRARLLTTPIYPRWLGTLCTHTHTRTHADMQIRDTNNHTPTRSWTSHRHAHTYTHIHTQAYTGIHKHTHTHMHTDT